MLENTNETTAFNATPWHDIFFSNVILNKSLNNSCMLHKSIRISTNEYFNNATEC